MPSRNDATATEVTPSPGPLPSLLAILAGALALLWPALFNRFPLLINDSLEYVYTGPVVFHALRHPSTLPDLLRSEIFAISLFALHQQRSFWPIIVVNALGASAMLFLALRCLLGRSSIRLFLASVAALALLTTLPWIVCLVTADVYGPFVYLAIALLVFCPEQLGSAERLALLCFIPWGLCAHMTHSILVTGIFVLLGALWLISSPWMLGRGRALLQIGVLLVIAGAAQVLAHLYLYGKPSLSGNAPPYLTARLMGDGTGRQYLLTHCGSLDWVLCRDTGNLPQSEYGFLWAPHSIWQTASTSTRVELRREQGPFVRATLRTYPRAQLRASAANARTEFKIFDYPFLVPNTLTETTDEVIPGSGPAYQRSREQRGRLHLLAVERLQKAVVILSAFALLFLLPQAWKQRRHRYMGLAIIVLFIWIANPVCTGILSGIDARYQCRIIWLIPFLALMGWLDRHSQQRERNQTFAIPS